MLRRIGKPLPNRLPGPLPLAQQAQQCRYVRLCQLDAKTVGTLTDKMIPMPNRTPLRLTLGGRFQLHKQILDWVATGQGQQIRGLNFFAFEAFHLAFQQIRQHR